MQPLDSTIRYYGNRTLLANDDCWKARVAALPVPRSNVLIAFPVQKEEKESHAVPYMHGSSSALCMPILQAILQKKYMESDPLQVH
jgi:hypothetical protein